MDIGDVKASQVDDHVIRSFGQVRILLRSASIARLILSFRRSPLATRLTWKGSTLSFLAGQAKSPLCTT